MKTEEPAFRVEAPWIIRMQGPLSLIAALLVGWFTGNTFAVLIRRYDWGAAGKPGWVAHIGLVGAVLGICLSLISVSTYVWHRRWVLRVPTMNRVHYRAWYTRSMMLGVPLALLCVPFGNWLARNLRVPDPALSVVFLGTVASVGITTLGTYYRLESLVRTQRDLLIQSQLAPHFLFNSLSTLKGQIAAEPLEAEATADRLARLFRDLMDLGQQTAVPLARELAFVEAYLGLEQARLGARLRVEIAVPSELEDVPVPPLCLQVLVENALRHAIAPRVEGGLLSIRAARVPEGLQLVVGDPGDGTSRESGMGRGLQVLRARLAQASDLRFEVLPQGHQALLLLRDA